MFLKFFLEFVLMLLIFYFVEESGFLQKSPIFPALSWGGWRSKFFPTSVVGPDMRRICGLVKREIGGTAN